MVYFSVLVNQGCVKCTWRKIVFACCIFVFVCFDWTIRTSAATNGGASARIISVRNFISCLSHYTLGGALWPPQITPRSVNCLCLLCFSVPFFFFFLGWLKLFWFSLSCWLQVSRVVDLCNAKESLSTCSQTHAIAFSKHGCNVWSWFLSAFVVSVYTFCINWCWLT